MWEVFEKKSVQKVFSKLPDDVIIKYEAWKRIAELQGPKGLRVIKGYHDEALKGKWKGFRSSRLGRKWRVIYHIREGFIEIYVFEINPHKY